MTITPDTLREIEEKAKAATPGPWQTDPDIGHESVLGSDAALVADCAIFLNPKFGRRDEETNKANAAHIARMDPPTTLALVARILELEGALKPFADAAEYYGSSDGWPDHWSPTSAEDGMRLGDLRRAATAYKGEKG